MGMYDSVRFYGIQFPDLQRYDGDEFEFQTKDLDNELADYVVTTDGRLIKKCEDEDKEVWASTNLTYTLHLRGPVDVAATFVNGHLQKLDFST